MGPIGCVSSVGFSKLYADAFVGIGSVAPRPLPKSKYVPSDFGIVVPQFKPSDMDVGAYLHWMSKLSRPRGRAITNDEYFRSMEVLEREFSPFVQGGLSTLEEVLLDVEWDKSPGWPYVNLGCTTKRQAWDKYKDEITQSVESLIVGEYVESTFIASLKDELLPHGKKARVFLPAPFHHQLACARLFKKAADSLTSTCHSHSSAIGINLFGGGLERAFRRLSSLPFGFDADQSGCDTSCKDVEPERDFMKTGLPPRYHAGVDLLFNQACCPRVIVSDRVLQLTMNPSGWYLTTVLNTLRTHRLVACAYLELSPGHSIDDMRRNLLQLNGGDDLAYSTNQPWFDIASLAANLADKGVYIESDYLTPRNPLDLTFFSHNLFLRKVDYLNAHIYVAGGRLSKILSSFSYLKVNDGQINWCRNASRVVGLMVNLWPYKFEYDQLYPYLYHMIHHFFLLSGRVLTSEWSGVFRSIPSDTLMMLLRTGASKESVLFFPPLNSSSDPVKRVFQSALKDSSCRSDTMSKVEAKTDHNTRQIDNILNRLEKAHGLTENGREWLISAVDPFHDFDLPISGFPDVSTDFSYNQVVKSSFNISATSGPTGGVPGMTSTSNWDCKIEIFPDLAFQAYTSTVIINNGGGLFNAVASTGNTINYSGVHAFGALSGTPLSIGGGSNVATLGVDGCGDYMTDGNFRIIGWGIEILNTTAEIYKQGTVTVFRKPCVPNIRNVIANSSLNTGTGTYYFPKQYKFLPSGPVTLSDAMNFAGSRQWNASEGAYVVARMNGTNQPFRVPYSENVVVWEPNPNGVQAYVSGSFLGAGQNSPGFPVNFDISGAYFTGLSPQTTLTVNVRYILERQPLSDKNMIASVTPPACYDPLALEIYTRALEDMPPGCRLAENPLGEWFRKVLDGVAKWAPKIGGAVNTVIPGAELIGKAIGQGAVLLKPKEEKKEQKKEAEQIAKAVNTAIKERRAILPASTTEAPSSGKKKKRIIYKKR